MAEAPDLDVGICAQHGEAAARTGLDVHTLYRMRNMVKEAAATKKAAITQHACNKRSVLLGDRWISAEGSGEIQNRALRTSDARDGRRWP